MHTPRLPFLTVFGLGRIRPAPGTWGSMPPVVVAGVLIALGLGPQDAPAVYLLVLAAIMLFFSAACIAQGDMAEAVFGKKDHGNVVADETAGQCVTLMVLPAAALATPLLAAFTLVLCFLCFRAMDIVKPWPANGLQKWPAGWGVLVDDLLAGLYAALLVHACAAIAL
ncbi:MAG: phosphatidylglycerophosphatase A family protein [Phycisphaerales bacterium]